MLYYSEDATDMGGCFGSLADRWLMSIGTCLISWQFVVILLLSSQGKSCWGSQQDQASHE